MSMISLIRKCVFIFATLSGWVIPNGAGANEMATFDSRHLWQGNITIGDAAYWKGNDPLMTIAPRRTRSGFYSPRNLKDAWRQFDHMLPNEFVSTASSLSRSHCLNGASRTVILLHNALAGFGYDAWIASKQFQFRKYLDQNVDLTPPSLTTASEFDREAGKTAMAWALCYYYEAKSSDGRFNFERAKADLSQQIEELRVQWKTP